MKVMKLVDIRYYLVSYTNNNLLFLFLYFQTLICKELLVLSSFFFQPLKKVCFQTEILGKFVEIYIFCFILLSLLHRLAVRKDQFAVSYFHTISA